MNFVKYLLVASMIVNLYYLYTYITLFEINLFQNVIPETENDYPPITKKNLRGMAQKVKNNVKINVSDALISEHCKSIYNGLNYIYSKEKKLCPYFGYLVAINDREIILHT